MITNRLCEGVPAGMAATSTPPKGDTLRAGEIVKEYINKYINQEARI